MDEKRYMVISICKEVERITNDNNSLKKKNLYLHNRKGNILKAY